MIAVPVAGVALAWAAYSIWQRRSLRKTVFPAMQLLSETRRPDGDLSNAQAVARGLVVMKSIPEGWSFIAGNPKAAGGPIYRAGNLVACQFDSDETSYGLYVPALPKTLSLPELFANRPPRSTYLEEDVKTRANYMAHAHNCLNASESPSGTKPFRGSYVWCLRDYVNYEELFSMLAARSCIEIVLFFPLQIGQITVNDNGVCTLRERSLLFGLIPLQIQWGGSVDNNRGAIAWETTSLRLGWKGFGKTFDKPTMSERLRKNNWIIKYPKGYEQTGEFVMLYREHHGTLVYKREG